MTGLLLATVGVAQADRAQAKQWFERAVALERAGEPGRALELYQRAIAEDLDYAPAYERAAPLWIQSGAFADAARALERFTLRNPRHAFAWYTLAYSYRRLGKSEYAALSYQSYIALRPGEAAPYFGLAMVLLDVGDQAGARRAFARYVDLERDPNRADFVRQAQRELAKLSGSTTVPRSSSRPAGRAPIAPTNADAAQGPANPVAPAAKVITADITAVADPTDDRTPAVIPAEHVASPSNPARSPRATAADERTPVDRQQTGDGLRQVPRLLASGRHREALTRTQPVATDSVTLSLERALWRARVLVAMRQLAQARTVLWALIAAAPTHVGAHALLAELRD